MRMNRVPPSRHLALCALALVPILATAQGESASSSVASLHARIDLPPQQAKERVPAAVLWLKPLSDSPVARPTSSGHYSLVQKNRMFTPHMLVIRVGSVVSFPNADPFFHNVFSLFNGKRFDLGLYEAGSSKEVVFSREGVSYIFCNIHPEMSAIVLALSTPYYAVAEHGGTFRLDSIPTGDYDLHVWVEGLTQPALDLLTRRVHVAPGLSNSLSLDARDAAQQPADHLNKFGQPYEREPKSPY